MFNLNVGQPVKTGEAFLARMKKKISFFIAKLISLLVSFIEYPFQRKDFHRLNALMLDLMHQALGNFDRFQCAFQLL